MRVHVTDSPVGSPLGTPVGTPVNTPVGTPFDSPVCTPRKKSNVMTNEEKRDAVLAESKFGMVSMTRILWSQRSPYVVLPPCLCVGQWLVFLAVVVHNLQKPQQCGSSSIEMKVLFIGVCLIYLVESVRLIDNLFSKPRKIVPVASYSTLLDTMHEHIFSLACAVTNLVIVYSTADILDGMFNCLAMKFLSDVENEWQYAYYSNRLQDAANAFDKIFVTRRENVKRVSIRRKSHIFKNVHNVALCVFSLTRCGYVLLPIFTFGMLVLGVVCK